MNAEVRSFRKSFLILSLFGRTAWGQDISGFESEGFVLEEIVVEAESLVEEAPPVKLRPLVKEEPQPLPVVEEPPVSQESEPPPPPPFSPRSATTLSGDELQRALQSTLGETLAGQPGVSASSFTRGSSRPIIRGLDGFRVLTLLDGLGTLDLSDESPDHGVSLDTELAESIEIYRGPSALRFGSGAIGGAVNTTTRLRPTLAPEGGWESALATGFDSQGNGYRGVFRTEVADGPWAVNAFVSRHQAGDITIPGNAWTDEYERVVRPRLFLSESQEGGVVLLPNPEGTLENSFHESLSWSTGLTFGDPESWQVGVSFAQFRSLYGIPYFFDGDETGLFGDSSIDTELNRVDADLSFNPQGRWGMFSELSLRVAGGWYEHAELFEGQGKDEGTDFATIEFDRQSVEGRLELVNGESDSILHGVSGIHYAANQLDARRFQLLIPGSDDTTLEQNFTGFYTTQKLSWYELSLALGVRSESGKVSSDTTGLLQESTDTLSRSLTLSWDTKRFLNFRNFGLSYTTSLTERAPSAVERYAFWSNEALGNIIIGGDLAAVFFPDIDGPLGIEKARHRELTLSGDWDGGSFSVTGYETDFDNFIFLESRSIGFQPSAAYVQREAKIRGLEGLVRFLLWEDKVAERGLDLTVSGDWIVGQDLTRRQELPRMPAPKVGATLSYESPRWNAFVEVRRSMGSGTTPDEPVPEFRTQAYTLVNAGVSWRPAWADDDLELSLRGSNLLDSEIREHTSFRKEASPQPGIGVSLDARWEF